MKCVPTHIMYACYLIIAVIINCTLAWKKKKISSFQCVIIQKTATHDPVNAIGSLSVDSTPSSRIYVIAPARLFVTKKYTQRPRRC